MSAVTDNRDAKLLQVHSRFVQRIPTISLTVTIALLLFSKSCIPDRVTRQLRVAQGGSMRGIFAYLWLCLSTSLLVAGQGGSRQTPLQYHRWMSDKRFAAYSDQVDLCTITHVVMLLNDRWLSRVFAGSGYAVQFSPTAAGRPQGSVMVLDVSSLWKKHPTQPSISIPDAGECQRRCSKLPGMV